MWSDGSVSSVRTDDVEQLRATAVAVAQQVGDLVLRMRLAGADQVLTKTSDTDVVTAADKAAERLARRLLAQWRPGEPVLGEEEGGEGSTTGGLCWVVDPIDGTVNYLYGIPQWGVSIGVEDDRGTLVGVVFDPAKDELWQAVRGRGSTLNGSSLRCSAASTLGQSLVATGFGYDERRRAAQARILPSLLPTVRDIRRLGSGALDLCAVAAGRVDAYYEQGLSPWDLSAGRLIATEAGARVGGLHGKPASHDLVVAAAPGVFDALHDLLVAADADRDPLAS